MNEVPPYPTHRHVLTHFERGVLHVTLNRPEARNALTAAMLEALRALFEAIEPDRSLRAVVLRGAGGHFCAGGDLNEMLAAASSAPPGSQDPLIRYSEGFGAMLRIVRAAPQVVIVVCEGTVLGGGLGLACVSDLAFAQQATRFGLPETMRGLPPAQIAPFVVERLGLAQARRLSLTGASFDGGEAKRLGLVHETFSDTAEADRLVEDCLVQIRQCAPQANALTKRLLLRLSQDTLQNDAAQQFAAAVRGPEAAEGIAAFREKRKPNWTEPT